MSDRPDMLDDLFDALDALIDARLAALPPDPPRFDMGVFTLKTSRQVEGTEPSSQANHDPDV